MPRSKVRAATSPGPNQHPVQDWYSAEVVRAPTAPWSPACARRSPRAGAMSTPRNASCKVSPSDRPATAHGRRIRHRKDHDDPARRAAPQWRAVWLHAVPAGRRPDLIFGIMGIINLRMARSAWPAPLSAPGPPRRRGVLDRAAGGAGRQRDHRHRDRVHGDPAAPARDHLEQVLATFALVLIFNQLVTIIFGRQPLMASPPALLSSSVELLPGAGLSGLSAGDHRGRAGGGGGALPADQSHPHRHADPRRGLGPRDGALPSACASG